MRDRLIELLDACGRCDKHTEEKGCVGCEYEYFEDKCENYLRERMADDLLANGVIVPPCKVGGDVYLLGPEVPCYACKEISAKCQANCDDCYKNQKWAIKEATVCGTSMEDNIKRVYMEVKETELTEAYRYTAWFEDFGKTVFLSREDAEKALKERILI